MMMKSARDATRIRTVLGTPDTMGPDTATSVGATKAAAHAENCSTRKPSMRLGRFFFNLTLAGARNSTSTRMGASPSPRSTLVTNWKSFSPAL